MKSLEELHNEAMNRAELALLARRRGDDEAAQRFFAESLRLELEAIELIDQLPYSEPNYSVLHRSAATLALDCNESRLAEKLISKALAHEPPAEIADELRDLLEQVHFLRHLELRGRTLAEDELQMSLAGQGVGFGMVEGNEFTQRYNDTAKLIYRIAERLQNQPFQEKGNALPRNDYALFMSTPRAASFAVTLKICHPAGQYKLPFSANSVEIIDEFMTLMTLANKADFSAIKSHIPDSAYRMNFVQLAKRLAPDGKKIKLVGFTSLREENKSFVEVTRSRDKMVTQESKPAEKTEPVVVTGVLRYADATKDSGEIKLIDLKSRISYKIKVPEGMMNDIVKPLWDNVVVVKGNQKGKYILLEDIEKQGGEE